MPLLQYFGWVGSFLLAALFAASGGFRAMSPMAPPSRAPLRESIHIRIQSGHEWPERVVFDTTRARLVTPRPKPSRKIKRLVRRLLQPGGITQSRPETVEGCLPPPSPADQNPESDAPLKRKSALL